MAIQPTNSEALEILHKGMRLATLKKMPFVKKEAIWKEYNNYINSLKQETFDNNIIAIVRTVNYGGKSAGDYKNAVEQRDAMVIRWSRLGTYPELLLDWIKECRKDGGYEV